MKHDVFPAAPQNSDLIDCAIGATASQSSLSQWSRPDEASNPISGNIYSDFAFHTAEEENPWWLLDIGSVYPIENIVVHNRVRMLQERAAHIRVEIAEKLGQWQLVHAGYASFGGGDNGAPLLLSVGGNLLARYVRISLDETQHLHLSKIQVMVNPRVISLYKFCIKHKLYISDYGRNATYKPAASSNTYGDNIVGLKIENSRRFGNLLIQYVNAIRFAENTRLNYIQLGFHALLVLKAPFLLNGIKFLAYDSELPQDGVFLAGDFFNSGELAPVLSSTLSYDNFTEIDIYRVCQSYIVPHLLSEIPVCSDQKKDEELTIHMRAGDLFNCDDSVTSGYRQPPLSFYILIIERMQNSKRINKVRLVFEDRGNPCVDALEAWLHTHNITFRTQCISLGEDLSALVNAKHLVFGHGTFGYAVCRLSKAINTVHFFAPQLGGRYEFIPSIDEVYEVADTGEYIKAYEYGKPFSDEDSWRRTPAMYEKMLEYPISKLAVKRIR